MVVVVVVAAAAAAAAVVVVVVVVVVVAAAAAVVDMGRVEALRVCAAQRHKRHWRQQQRLRKNTGWPGVPRVTVGLS